MFTSMYECTWVAPLRVPVTEAVTLPIPGSFSFKDEITDAVARHEPYTKQDVTRTRQDEDEVFVAQHGRGSMLALTQLHKQSIEDGFLATAVLGIDPNAITSSLIFETALIF
jgi:hypothetical protein